MIRLLWQRSPLHRRPSRHRQYLARLLPTERAASISLHGRSVYGRPFQVIACASSDVPPAHEPEQALGRHLDGYRVGFDLGASDLKVSAVANGEAVFSEEIVWEPRRHSDPQYHSSHIVSAIRMAAEKLPRLDAIGGSAAGVYVDNRPMVASLFRGVPDDRYHLVRDMFLRIRDEFGAVGCQRGRSPPWRAP
jgi:hypothetical protein